MGMLAGAVAGFIVTVIFARQLGIWGGAPVLGGAMVGGVIQLMIEG